MAKSGSQMPFCGRRVHPNNIFALVVKWLLDVAFLGFVVVLIFFVVCSVNPPLDFYPPSTIFSLALVFTIILLLISYRDPGFNWNLFWLSEWKYFIQRAEIISFKPQWFFFHKGNINDQFENFNKYINLRIGYGLNKAENSNKKN